jgi:hypothetical protein
MSGLRLRPFEFEVTPALVFLDRGRLRAAGAAGHLDGDTVCWAEAAMDSCGIPDGLPVVTLDGAIFEPAWRWQRSAPQAQAAGTRERYVRDVRRLIEHLAERGIEFQNVTTTDLRAFAQRRKAETASST